MTIFNSGGTWTRSLLATFDSTSDRPFPKSATVESIRFSSSSLVTNACLSKPIPTCVSTIVFRRRFYLPFTAIWAFQIINPATMYLVRTLYCRFPSRWVTLPLFGTCHQFVWKGVREHVGQLSTISPGQWRIRVQGSPSLKDVRNNLQS